MFEVIEYSVNRPPSPLQKFDAEWKANLYCWWCRIIDIGIHQYYVSQAEEE